MMWLVLIFIVALAFILIELSQGAQPTWMHCREMRIRYGTRRKLMTGYQVEVTSR